MSKRKPALWIGGGVLNRSTLSSSTKVTRMDETLAKDATHDQIESQLANFMKEIDKVSAVPSDSHKQDRYGDWQKCLDEKTQHWYYWNVVTDAVSWVLPDEISRNTMDPAADSVVQDSELTIEKYKENATNKLYATQSETQHLPNEESRDIPETVTQAPTEAHLHRKTTDQSNSSESLSNVSHSKNVLPNKVQQITSSKVEVGTQCKLCSAICSVHHDSSSSKMEVLQLRDTLVGKMNYLGVSNASLMHLQILLIQIETRISDWKSRVLPTSYVLEKLNEAQSSLKAFEDNATPAGWTCHWDSAAAKYYYVNEKSRHKQWNYPEILPQAEVRQDSESEVDKTNSNHTSEQDGPNPPLPDTPAEQPPPPPEDDGYDVDEDVESPKKCDDGIMMEISEDEKEESTEQEAKAPMSSVVSQQPIIYKGFDGLSRLEHNVRNEPNIGDQQSYSFTHYKEMPIKLKSKKTKGGKKTVKPYKAMSSLVAQWQRAKEEIDEEDRKLEESDEEEKEESTHMKIVKWKQDQIISGKAVSNPNFEPVPTDWRTRLMGKKKKS